MGLLENIFNPILDVLPNIEIPNLFDENKSAIIKFKDGGGVNWIQKATQQMEKKGTVGLFTKKAKEHGLNAIAYAKKVIESPQKHTNKTFKEAMFVKNANPELFAKGGKVAKITKRASGGSVRYSSKRKGPSDSATWYSPGETQIGNDGNWWRIAQNVNGINRWQKMDDGGTVTDLNETHYDFDWRDVEHDVYQENGFPTKQAALKRIKEIQAEDGEVVESWIYEDGKYQGSFYGKGGKTQGYAARQDESLGMRTGKESSKKQSMKARREDSYGKWGKRDSEKRGASMAKGGDIADGEEYEYAYQDDVHWAVSDMTKNQYSLFTDTYGLDDEDASSMVNFIGDLTKDEAKKVMEAIKTKKYKDGGKINKEWLSHQSQAYTDRILKSIADYYRTSASSIRKEIYDKDAEMIYEYIGNDRGLQRKVHEEMEAWMFSYNKYAKGGKVKKDFKREIRERGREQGHNFLTEDQVEGIYQNYRINEPERNLPYAKGGKTQGYNARLDESLGNRTGRRGTKSQSYKSRRDESKGTEKSMGKRPYSSVGTMDKNVRSWAELKPIQERIKKMVDTMSPKEVADKWNKTHPLGNKNPFKWTTKKVSGNNPYYSNGLKGSLFEDELNEAEYHEYI